MANPAAALKLPESQSASINREPQLMASPGYCCISFCPAAIAALGSAATAPANTEESAASRSPELARAIVQIAASVGDLRAQPCSADKVNSLRNIRLVWPCARA